ncbi:MAG: response regulator transcription factor [Spirochaetales bacterium]|nr:response regulator transcription factor [Spirochaetales bacterium]
MFTVLIIDDERNIRENLKSLINWGELGFSICGEADNGDEGLVKHNLLKPNLVLVDIRMPGLNGLDMIKAIKKSNNMVKILIITGYSHFDYAKQAIEYGVDGYLLKPVDENELRDKIIMIRSELQRRKEENELVEKSRHTVMEQFLISLIKGELTDDNEMEKRCRENSLIWKSYQLFMVESDKAALLTHVQKSKMKELIFEAMISRIPGYILEVDGVITGLFEKKIIPSSGDDMKGLVRSLKDIAYKDITLYIGKQADTYKEICVVYKQIKAAMSKRFFYRTSDVVFASPFITKTRIKDTEFSEADLTDQLYMAMDMNKEKEIEQILSRLHSKILNTGQEEENVKSKYLRMLYTIIKRIAESREDMYHLLSEYDKIIRTISEVKFIDELYSLIKEKLLQISFELFATRPMENVIKRVIEYIETYYNTNIKLKNLSELFHYNSAYFGQLFKEKTGHHFNTYIDMVRIEKAKEFLLRGLKVYEAAEQTGFSDVDNFYKKFKKYAGMSPSDYKKQYKG